MQGLLCRAKRLDIEKVKEGYYVSTKHNDKHWLRWDGSMYLIDPQTLQYQINDKWYSKAELEAIIAKEL